MFEDYLENILVIVANTEKEVNKIFKDSTLTDPIDSDIVLSKRNMAYNKIKSIIKEYKNKRKKGE